MKILIIGQGGREHALAWKLKQSPKVSRIYCIPGNAGIAQLAECITLDDDNPHTLAQFASDNAIDITLVGPEAPLVEGIVDVFNDKGLKVFGPEKKGAMIEGSKDFAKSIMKKYNVPTADFRVFTHYSQAKEYIDNAKMPIVIKADGLAAGKGVTVAKTREEAVEALKLIMLDKKFGDAGEKVVIEEFLEGEEATVLAFTDGKTIVPMVPSQDHKPAYDNDEGPNTGGMGAYSPAPLVTDKVYEKICARVLNPMIDAFSKEGIEYKGVLYAGLMINNGEPYVVEFNCRFGDPEAQVVLPRLDTDLIDIIEAVINENLGQIEIKWKGMSSVCVVMASGGYPGKYEKGMEIKGLKAIEAYDDMVVFHAGTKVQDGKILTDGGRVLGVTALAPSIKDAQKRAYEGVEKIEFKDAHYRTDIGGKALR